MQDKNKLLEMLNDIIEIAKTKNNELTTEEIKSFLNGLDLKEEQIQIVYDYLVANKITIKGYISTSNEFINVSNNADSIDENNASLSTSNTDNIDDNLDSEENTKDTKDFVMEEERAFLDMYLKDISAIQKISEEEIKEYRKSYLDNDEIAKTRIVEQFLVEVVEIAKEYKNQGISIADLIQEGNIGLMQSMEQYKFNHQETNFREFILDGIRSSITDVLMEQKNSKNFSKRIAEKMTNLSESVKVLKEDLGKKPTIDELSDYMKLNKEEIKDLIRMSKEEDLDIDFSKIKS